MDIFTLRAQILGRYHDVVARSDGYGITVETPSGNVRTSSVREAMRMARNALGPVLHDADRRRLAWGLYVVGEAAAVYGDWPLLSAGPTPTARTRDTVVARIRREWHDGSALSALENALRIIEAYTSRRKAA